MKHVLFTCFAALAMAASPPGLRSAAAQTVSPDLLAKAEAQDTVRIIVRLDVPFDATRSVDQAEAQAFQAAQSRLTRSLGGELAYAEAIEGLPLSVLEVTAEQLRALQDNENVAVVQEDELAAPILAQSIPLIEADTAHGRGQTGSGHAVAVLDTGVDLSHAAFAGKIVSQACYSTTSSANGGSQSLCPGGAAASTANGSGNDCSSSISGCGHGTHVAGIAAGNGGGVTGVAPGAQVVAVQVFSRFNSAATCAPRAAPCVLSYTSDQIKGLTRVRALAQAGTIKIASANMSIGGGKSTTACDGDGRKPVIDQLRALGVATVIASGNDGFSDGVSFPGCVSTAVTVGSTTKSDTLSSFSNSAAMVDLLAPGSSINSARAGGGTVTFNGTSMATPHVAGAFALHRGWKSGDSVATIEAKLKSTGTPVTGKGITKPRIDVGYVGQLVLQPVKPLKSPLAFGTVWFNGAKQKGYGNWSSTFNSTYNRYEITMTGQNYYYLNYVTVITPMDNRFCKSSSVSGKLLVYCYTHSGQPATSRFGFVTYKP